LKHHFFVKDFSCKRYFKNGNTAEKALANKADQLWRGVRAGGILKGRDTLLALVSNYNWEMNFKLEGYNECLVTYVMAASSPTFPISSVVYIVMG
jgi:hypothetical protein